MIIVVQSGTGIEVLARQYSDCFFLMYQLVRAQFFKKPLFISKKISQSLLNIKASRLAYLSF